MDFAASQALSPSGYTPRMATTLPATDLTPYLTARLERLRARCAELDLHGFLVTDPASRRYLSGFTGSAGVLLVVPDGQYLSTDSRYYTQGALEAPLFTLVKAGYGYVKGLAEELPLGGMKIGIDKDQVTLGFFDQLRETCPETEWTPTSKVIQELRAIKDDYELTVMRQAIALGDAALELAIAHARPGVTENELITHYLQAVREVGAEGPSYEPIFGGGPNAAIVHHRGSDRPLERGDVLLIDAGVKYQGYCSDLTRVFCIAEETPLIRELYEIVLKSHLYGYEVTGDGARAKEVDLATRAIIEEAGYGDYYGHSFGHGIGLEVHELPRVSRLSEDTLRTGMVHTIEPGIYLPGQGGVRIEDICWLSPQGPVQLSGAPKDLRVLG